MNPTTLPAAVTPPENAKLNERYRTLFARCDRLAINYKRSLLWLWTASMVLTWVPLLLAIAAMSGWLPSGIDPLLLTVVLPWAGFTNSVVTAAQFVFAFRGRWLKYRAAAERLRENCMRFRVRLTPFADADAEERFRTALDELETELDDRKPLRLWDAIPWAYLVGLKPLPEKLRGPFDHTPDRGLYPRCDPDIDAEKIIILDRLRNQQRWHLVGAGSCSRRYLLLQAGIVLLGLASAGYGWFVGRHFGPLALFSTATLFLVSWRELLGDAPLCVRYTRIEKTLDDIETEYRKLLDANPSATPQQRLEWLRHAAARVEQALASEFQYWYFGRQNIGGTAAT